MNILITHAFGFANKGDWALLKALITTLQEAFPDATLRGICRNPTAQTSRFPEVQWYQQMGTSYRSGFARRLENAAGLTLGAMRCLLGRTWERGSVGAWGRHARRLGGSDARRLGGSLREVFADADLIVACPGGYLEDTNTSIVTNAAHLWLSLRTGAPVVLAPQSIGPFRQASWRRIMSRLLRQTSAIFVREAISRHLLVTELDVPAPMVSLSCDMAFYDDSSDDRAADLVCREAGLKVLPDGHHEPFACATLIDWYFPFDADPAEARRRYIAELSGAIRKLHEQCGLRTLLLKQIESDKTDPGDDAIIREVSRLAGHAAVLSLVNHPPEVMRGILGRAAIFLASRMHSGIFALQMGTPVVAIAYLPKTAGIMSMCGLEEFVIGISGIQSDALFEKAELALASPERFKLARDKAADLAQRDKALFVAALRSVGAWERHNWNGFS